MPRASDPQKDLRPMLELALASFAKVLPAKSTDPEQDARERFERDVEDLLAFVPRISRRFAKPVHLRPLIEQIARAVRGEPVRVLVSVPPRHAKTESILHAIAWALTKDPSIIIGYATYEAGLARSKSRNARDYARSAGVRIREDADALSEWRTPEGGGVLAAGVGGPWTGHGLRILVVDDPFKNQEEAESLTIREKVHGWCTSTGFTRLEPNGAIFVVHTRWHTDDLIARLQDEAKRYDETGGTEGEPWLFINLQAINDDTGEALWPERWPLEILEGRKRTVGVFIWEALFQGRPRKKGGELFRDPARYESVSLVGKRILIGVDVAATKSTKADHSVAVVIAYWWEPPRDEDGVPCGTPELWADVLHVESVQEEIPEVCDKLEALQKRWSAQLVIEDAGVGKSVPQFLRRINPRLRIVTVTPSADKFLRAQPVSSAWNGGRVRVPHSASWLDDFLHVVCKFVGIGDARDDEVDALAHAFNQANGNGPSVGTYKTAGAREMTAADREQRKAERAMRERFGIGGGGREF